jgi:hypothetical protein
VWLVSFISAITTRFNQLHRGSLPQTNFIEILPDPNFNIVRSGISYVLIYTIQSTKNYFKQLSIKSLS